jgi:hypothetical protein
LTITNTSFGNVTATAQIGNSGWYCIYNGSTSHSTPITVTNLSSNTTYRVMVIEYTGAASSEIYDNYASATNNPNNQLTAISGTISLNDNSQISTGNLNQGSHQSNTLEVLCCSYR